MLCEVDDQLAELSIKPPSIVIVPIGVGSFAHAVIAHYKRTGSPVTKIVAVEGESAPCLQTSLRKGQIFPIETTDTIMNGMNCGTVSTISWPVLKLGVDVSITVSDIESHEAIGMLRSEGVIAGPCGAAQYAALRKLITKHNDVLDLKQDSAVLLFCTEGGREYVVPVVRNK